MKIVHFADLHLDSAFSNIGATAARKRRQALRDTLLNIIALTERVGADALLCAGDLYEHDRFAPDTGTFLREAFGKLGNTRVFIAPGNHDWYGRQSLYNAVDWSPNVHIFREPTLIPFNLADGLTLWGAAHRGPANTPDFLEGFHVDRNGVNLAVFHGSERAWFTEQETGKQPHAPFSAPEIERAGLRHAFLGHFHRPKEHNWFTYPGNPDPLTFGENGVRGAVVVTVRDDGSIERKWERVAKSKSYEIDVDITGAGSQQDIRDRVNEKVKGLEGYARITLNGEIDQTIDFRLSDFHALQSSLDFMAVRPGNIQYSYDIESIAEEQTVRGEFVKSVLAQDLSDYEKRRILFTGLRALDGRNDLEVL